MPALGCVPPPIQTRWLPAAVLSTVVFGGPARKASRPPLVPRHHGLTGLRQKANAAEMDARDALGIVGSAESGESDKYRVAMTHFRGTTEEPQERRNACKAGV